MYEDRIFKPTIVLRGRTYPKYPDLPTEESAPDFYELLKLIKSGEVEIYDEYETKDGIVVVLSYIKERIEE